MTTDVNRGCAVNADDSFRGSYLSGFNIVKGMILPRLRSFRTQAFPVELAIQDALDIALNMRKGCFT
jgi:hypothetical protein